MAAECIEALEKADHFNFFQSTFLYGSYFSQNWSLKFGQCRTLYKSTYYENLGDSGILNHQIMIFEFASFRAAFLYPEKNAIQSQITIILHRKNNHDQTPLKIIIQVKYQKVWIFRKFWSQIFEFRFKSS